MSFWFKLTLPSTSSGREHGEAFVEAPTAFFLRNLLLRAGISDAQAWGAITVVRETPNEVCRHETPLGLLETQDMGLLWVAHHGFNEESWPMTVEASDKTRASRPHPLDLVPEVGMRTLLKKLGYIKIDATHLTKLPPSKKQQLARWLSEEASRKPTSVQRAYKLIWGDTPSREQTAAVSATLHQLGWRCSDRDGTTLEST